MPGFLGGFAGGLAKSIEKAGDDYTKDQKDLAAEERQAARVDKLRQTINSEQFHNPKAKPGEFIPRVLYGSKGEVVAQLEGAQADFAEKHNQDVAKTFESTQAKNTLEGEQAKGLLAARNAWRAANPNDPRTYEQYQDDRESDRDLNDSITLAKIQGGISRSNSAYNASLDGSTGGGLTGKRWGKTETTRSIGDWISQNKIPQSQLKAIGQTPESMKRLLAAADSNNIEAQKYLIEVFPKLSSIGDSVSPAGAGAIDFFVKPQGSVFNKPKEVPLPNGVTFDKP